MQGSSATRAGAAARRSPDRTARISATSSGVSVFGHEIRHIAGFALVAAILSALVPAHAQTDDERRAKIAVRVGESTVSVGSLEDRLAAIPPFQLQTFGGSRDAIVRKFVDDVVVREMLLVEGADKRGLAKEEPWQHQLKRARSSATLRALRGKTPSAAAIPAEDVKRFYEENRSRFDSPERVNLWRILVKTREDAAAVLAEAKREPTIAKYNDLARRHSIDKATNLRGGNLGFLAPDGRSNEAGVKVDPALVEAAGAVRDGELVPQPVPEAGGFAVVWRRATVPANRRTLEESTAQIRATLYRERTEGAEKGLMDALRAEHVKEVNEDLLKIIELGATDAGLTIPRSTPAVPPRDAR
jgi:peptidyl-prolyl cis-trans isomerase C